jgi:glycogen debranching enzyme
MARARAWLDELQTPTGLRASSATGRYYALFGRDSLWSVLLALEAARLRPEDGDLAQWSVRLAERTLRVLAETQGTRRHDETEEQPGKIVHEYWPEPPRRLTQNGWPLDDAGRYYGSADGTYLFLMAATAVWEQAAGGRPLVESLWDHVLAALRWALADGDPDGDGLMEAWPRQPRGLGLTNQVWKDSGDALILEDGSVPEPPVAWVELQGYAIAAFRGVREMLRARGEDAALQDALAQRIARIEAQLGRFWLPDEGYPAMALTREKIPVPLVSSNSGHLLWCGALGEERSEATANRLLRPDLLSAWGIRTLSARSYAFDATSYHRGSVWPFDNAIAAGALWRMGRRADARQIGRRVIAALERFDSPVELYCVLPPTWVRAPDIDGHEVLLDYRRASAVQAWSAAGLLLFAAQLLAAG